MSTTTQQEQIIPIPLIVSTRCRIHQDEVANFSFVFTFVYTRNMIAEYKKLSLETDTPFAEILLLHVQDEASSAGMVNFAKQQGLSQRCPTNEKTEDEIQFHPSFHWEPLANAPKH